VERKNEDVF
jgi:hypothetical protein